MVAIYRKWFSKTGAGPRHPQTLESLKETHDYPILNAEELVRLVGVGGRINSIRQNAALDPARFDALYKVPIERFLEAAQLQPASASDHHARLGGLIEHTLDVVERAMAHRRHLQLPTNSHPEVIARQRDVWTYVIFVGALLHDAGKLLTLTKLHPDKDKNYSPLGASILSTKAETYQIEFLQPNYEYQVRISLAMLSYIPAEGMAMLANNQQAFQELTAWLSNLPYEWGTVGKVCQEADMGSVSYDMVPGGNRARLHNAGRPLAERLMGAIRAELATESVPINRDGALGWVQNDTLWLVCKPTVERARRRMKEMGATDVPGEDKDEILFDALMAHGYCVPSSQGQSVWYVRVKSPEGEYDHPLTMLRFDAARAIPPTRQIKSFVGSITVIEHEELHRLRAEQQKILAINTVRLPPASSISDAEVWQSQETVALMPDVQTIDKSNSSEEETKSTTRTLSKPDSSSRATVKSKKSPPSPPLPDESAEPEEKLTGSRHAASTINKLVAQDHASVRTDPVTLDDPTIGRYFLTWVRDSHDSGLLTANTGNDSKLHIIPEGVALVNPALLNQFLALHDMADARNKTEITKARDKIRKTLKTQGLLIKTESGYDIHHVLLPKGRFSIVRLYTILVPSWALFDPADCPAVNESVTLRKGRYKPDSPPPPAGAV